MRSPYHLRIKSDANHIDQAIRIWMGSNIIVLCYANEEVNNLHNLCGIQNLSHHVSKKIGTKVPFTKSVANSLVLGYNIIFFPTKCSFATL